MTTTNRRRIAAAVPIITEDAQANVAKIQEMMRIAAGNGAKLIVFPEAVVTGLANTDVYQEDLRLALSLESPVVQSMKDLARQLSVSVCFGLLEEDHGRIYDSALLIGADGEIAIHYRRMNHQWRDRSLPKEQYGEGEQPVTAMTDFGRTAILICGDLFDDAVVAKLKEHSPQLLLFPFARCFNTSITDGQGEWDKNEAKDYCQRVKLVQCPAIMANYIADVQLNGGGFGGAFVVSEDGEMKASLPLREEGILYYDL